LKRLVLNALLLMASLAIMGIAFAGRADQVLQSDNETSSNNGSQLMTKGTLFIQ
jgi:hypothetical protein